MELDADRDAEIGQEVYRRLHRLVEQLAKKHGIPGDRAADFLIAGALFVAAGQYDLSIDETLEVAETIAESVQRDTLAPATRH